MQLYTITGTIFMELIAVAMAIASFLLFMRECGRKRSWAMGWFAGSSLALFAALFMLFLGQYLASLGALTSASLCFQVMYVAIVAHAFCVVQGAFTLKKLSQPLKMAFSAICIGAGAYVLRIFWGRIPQLQFVQGIAFAKDGEPADIAGAVASAVVLATIALLAVVAHREARAKGIRERFTTAFLVVFAMGGLVTVSAFLQETFFLGVFLLLTLATLPVYVGALTVGVLSCADPDPAVQEEPLRVFRRDLLLKAMASIAVVMTLASFSVQIAVSKMFVDVGTNDRLDRMERAMDRLAMTYTAQGKRLYAQAVRAAADPFVKGAVQRSEVSEAPELIGKAQDEGIVVIPAMTVLDAAALPLAYRDGSSVVARALAARTFRIGTERGADGVWMLRAAAPMMTAGTVSHVVLVEGPIDAMFAQATDEMASLRFGYGFALASGEVPFFRGSSLDRISLHRLMKAALGDHDAVVGDVDEGRTLVRRHHAADGSVAGYFYVAESLEARDTEMFSEVALVTMIVVTAMVLTLMMVYTVLYGVLRPVGRLRVAVEKLEKDNYGFKIGHHGIDEVGLLASSFDRMQEAIARRTEALRASVREQRDFVDHMSHELRNPINIFRWTLEMMRGGDTGRLNKEQLELLEQLHQTNEHLTRVAQNMQDAILIDRGTIQLKRVPVVVEDVIDEAAGAVAVQVRTAGIVFHWNRPKIPMPRVNADRAYLTKAIMKIVTNAVKYTAKGGHVEVVVERSDERSPGGPKGAYVKVTVEDNGIGIPADEQKHIFKKFYRARNARSKDFQGAGLGLYIAKEVLSLHGGDIWLASKEENGASFSFTVPVFDGPGASA